MRDKNYCFHCGKSLKNKFIDNKRRLFCQKCNEIIYENPIPATASIIVQNNKILLVKRKIDPKKGQWSLPGGFIELNETPENACLRELREETGLLGKIDRLIDARYSSSILYNSVIVIGYLIKDIKGNLIAGDDAEEAAFFNLNDIPQLAFNSHKKILDIFLNKK